MIAPPLDEYTGCAGVVVFGAVVVEVGAGAAV